MAEIKKLKWGSTTVNEVQFGDNEVAKVVYDGNTVFLKQYTLTLDASTTDSGATNGTATITFEGNTTDSIIPPTRPGYTALNYYADASKKILLMNALGSLQPNVLGYTDANSQWIRVGNGTAYTEWIIDSVEWRITVGDGIEKVYYKVNGSQTWTDTSVTKTVPVTCWSTIYWYATPKTGYIANYGSSTNPNTISVGIDPVSTSVAGQRITGVLKRGTLPTGVASLTCYRQAWNASDFSAFEVTSAGSTITYGDKFYWTATAADYFNNPTVTYGSSSNCYTWTGTQGTELNDVTLSGLTAGSRKTATATFAFNSESSSGTGAWYKNSSTELTSETVNQGYTITATSAPVNNLSLWLPLDGNLANKAYDTSQELLDYNYWVNSKNITFNSTGGATSAGCAVFNVADWYDYSTYPEISINAGVISGEYISTRDRVKVSPNMTYAAWIYPTFQNGLDNILFDHVLTNESGTSDQGLCILIDNYTSNNVKVKLYKAGQQPWTINWTVDFPSTPTWMHLCITFNNTDGKARLYINGNMVGTPQNYSFADMIGTTSLTPISLPLTIGSATQWANGFTQVHWPVSSQPCFTGYLNDVRIYNGGKVNDGIALTAEQVQTLYQCKANYEATQKYSNASVEYKTNTGSSIWKGYTTNSLASQDQVYAINYISPSEQLITGNCTITAYERRIAQNCYVKLNAGNNVSRVGLDTVSTTTPTLASGSTSLYTETSNNIYQYAEIPANTRAYMYTMPSGWTNISGQYYRANALKFYDNEHVLTANATATSIKYTIGQYALVGGTVYWSKSAITTSGGSTTLSDVTYGSTVYWRIAANTEYNLPSTYYGSTTLNESNFYITTIPTSVSWNTTYKGTLPAPTRKTFTITFPSASITGVAWSGGATKTAYYGDRLVRTNNTWTCQTWDSPIEAKVTRWTNSIATSGTTAQWNYTITAGGDTVNSVTSNINPLGTITETQGSERNYTVTFTAGTRGSWSSASITAPYSATISRSGDVVSVSKSGTTTQTSTYSGYTITGYTTTPVYSVPSTVGTGAAVKVTSLTDVAKTYNFTLGKNGGPSDGSATATYNSSSLTNWVAVGAREGYTNTGYYTASSSGTKLINTDGTLIANVSGYTDSNKKWIKDTTSALTFYAYWTANSYNISITKNTDVSTIYYKVNGASSWSSTTSSITVSATYATTVYWYATAEAGYTVNNGGSASSPNSFTMGISASIAPTATRITWSFTIYPGNMASAQYWIDSGSKTTITASKTVTGIDYGSTLHFKGVTAKTGFIANTTQYDRTYTNAGGSYTIPTDRISGTISQGTLPTGVKSITTYRREVGTANFVQYTGSTITYGDQFYWTATAATGYNNPSVTYGSSSNYYTWQGSQGGSITAVGASGLTAGSRKTWNLAVTQNNYVRSWSYSGLGTSETLSLMGNGYTSLSEITINNPAAGATSQHNRIATLNLSYNKIESKMMSTGSGASGAITLSGSWWANTRANPITVNSISGTWSPSYMAANTWYDVTVTLNSNASSLQICGWSDSTNYWTPQTCKYQYIKAYNGTKLVLWLVPVKRNIDNVIGFFDKLTGNFYPNVGSGGTSGFTAGTNYIPVEYIQSSGTQYIDTGITVGTNVSKIDIEAQQSIQSDVGCLVGAGTADTAGNGWGFYTFNNSNYGCLSPAIAWYQFGTSDLNRHIFNITLDGTTTTVLKDGTQIGNPSDTYWGVNFSWRNTSFKICKGSYSTGSNQFKGKIYYCKIYNNNNLVRDFVPVKRASDNTFGLLDKVHNQFYGNSGSGSFTGGSSFIPIEYIQSTGTQYIDTGVNVNLNTHSFEIESQSTDTSQNGMAFGEWVNTGGFYWWLYYYNGGSTITLYATNTSSTQIPITTGLSSSNTNRNVFTWMDKKMYVNGSLTSDQSSTTFSSSLTTARICDTNIGSGVSSWPFKGKVYCCRIWNGSEFVRDFIAVKRSSDNVVGMYDRVNNVFYANNGSGSFTAGPTKIIVAGSYTIPNIDFATKVTVNGETKEWEPGASYGVFTGTGTFGSGAQTTNLSTTLACTKATTPYTLTASVTGASNMKSWGVTDSPNESGSMSNPSNGATSTVYYGDTLTVYGTAADTTYGSWTTNISKPTIGTITGNSIVVNNPNGVACTLYYGTTSSASTSWGTINANSSATVTGLSGNTTYYFKLYSASYGEYRTKQTYSIAKSITQTTVTGNVTATFSGTKNDIEYEYQAGYSAVNNTKTFCIVTYATAGPSGAKGSWSNSTTQAVASGTAYTVSGTTFTLSGVAHTYSKGNITGKTTTGSISPSSSGTVTANMTVTGTTTDNGWTGYTLTKSVTGGSYGTYTVTRTSSPNAGAATGELANGATIYYGDILSGSASANGTSYGSWGSWDVSSLTAPTITSTGDSTTGNITVRNADDSHTVTLYYNTSNATGGTSLGSVASGGTKTKAGLSFSTTYYASAYYQKSRKRTKYVDSVSGTPTSSATVTGNTTMSCTFVRATTTDTGYGDLWSSVTSHTTAARSSYSATVGIKYGSTVLTSRSVTKYYGETIYSSTYYNEDTYYYNAQYYYTGKSTSSITVTGAGQGVYTTYSTQNVRPYTITFPSTTYGTWSSGSGTAYYGDYMYRDGNTWYCKAGGSGGSARWSSTLSANSPTAQYTYSATASGNNFTVTGAATAGTATSSASTRSYTVTYQAVYSGSVIASRTATKAYGTTVNANTYYGSTYQSGAGLYNRYTGGTSDGNKTVTGDTTCTTTYTSRTRSQHEYCESTIEHITYQACYRKLYNSSTWSRIYDGATLNYGDYIRWSVEAESGWVAKCNYTTAASALYVTSDIWTEDYIWAEQGGED